MKIVKTAIALTFCVLFVACQAQKSFVKVKGTNFAINDKPHHFVGTNFWYGAYLGADADYGNRPRLIRELDQMKKNGITNLRVVAASEESDYGLPLDPPFQYKNGTYNETLLSGLDFLLAEMQKRDMRAVMVLNNNWDWSGGMGQYVSWVTGKKVVDPSVNKNETWDDYLKFAGAFYTLPEAQKMYKNYIEMLLNRTNTVTKKSYKNDTAIFSWELANEPRPLNTGDKDENVKIFSKWVDDTAGFIHSIDANHLVTTGSEGSKGTLNSLDYTFQAHNSKNIDYITFHMWPKNWGWYKAEKPEMMGKTKEFTAQYIKEQVALAQKLNKPSVIEEFGFVRDGEKCSPESSTKARNEYFQFILQIYKDAIVAGQPLNGVNFWGWGGEGRGQQKDNMWKKGDTTFTADPYSEAQGLNSIYNTDKSTIAIIANNAKEIKRLSKKLTKK